MSISTIKPLTLFDPDDKHDWCDVRFNNRLLIRFIDSTLCRNHVNVNDNDQELDMHLFMPENHMINIAQWAFENNNHFKHIYCQDERSTKEIRKQYNKRDVTNVFPAEELEVELSHIHVKLLCALTKLYNSESQEYNDLVVEAQNELEYLSHKIRTKLACQMSAEVSEYQ